MNIGITSTIPSEILLSAGHSLVDLNNTFITSTSPRAMITVAERRGFPKSCCGWIRGIYGAALAAKPQIDAVITVMGGDCSNTYALAEAFLLEGLDIIPFSYPYERSYGKLEAEMKVFAQSLGTDLGSADETRRSLKPVRKLLLELDEALAEGRILPGEYHSLAVSSSDFLSDVGTYRVALGESVKRAQCYVPDRSGVPIALLGVPPIIANLPETLLEIGLRVVYDEIPRQFSMIIPTRNLVEQYLAYSYPYGMSGRIQDIRLECERRGVQGVIHYTQSFCFRSIEDILLRDKLDLPVLTIEGDEPNPADERLRLRLESFHEMLAGV